MTTASRVSKSIHTRNKTDLKKELKKFRNRKSTYLKKPLTLETKESHNYTTTLMLNASIEV